MSELGFTGKIPIPNLTKFGDLSGEIRAQQKFALESGALAAKQKAAKAKAMKEQQANQAKVMAQMGGLYKNLHPYAIPFAEEAYENLQQDAMKFMMMENGAELFKPYVENFKASVEPYVLNQEMMKRRGELTAMIDHSGEEYKAANKEVGNLFNVVANEDMVFAADEHQFNHLMENATLEYNQGRFKIMGQAYNRATGQVSDEVTELSVTSGFNDPSEYQYGTQRANVKSLRMIGNDLQTIDKKAAAESGWDAERVTDKYRELFTDFVDFDAMAETDNDAYAFRLAAYFETRDDVLARSHTARNFKTEEELLEYYELDPKKRVSGDSALYDLVQGAVEEAWTTKTLPHTIWEKTESASSQKRKLSILGNSAMATFGLNQLPVNIQTGQPVEGIVLNEDTKNVRSIVYPLEAAPGTQMETIKATRINPKYYEQMSLYLTYRNSKGEPYAIVNPDTGKVEFMPPEPPANLENLGAAHPDRLAYEQDKAESAAMGNLFNEVDFYKTYNVEGYRVYENNPSIYVVELGGNGGQIMIDRDNINTADDQMIHASLNIGLDKSLLDHDDLWNDAVTKFGTPTTTTTTAGQSR